MILRMKRHIFLRALTLGIAAGALTLTSCSTTESRISEHPEIFNSLSANDRAIVQQGKIRTGMSQDAVWLAWGAADQKFAGSMRNRTTETWVYVTYETAYPYPYMYRPFYGPRYGFGFTGLVRSHNHHRFAFYGDPFYDPFYYSYIPPSIPVPYKTVTFSGGRVLSFQYRMLPQE